MTQPADSLCLALKRLCESPGTSYAAVHMASSAERVAVVQDGVHAALVAALARDMRVPRSQVCNWLGLARSTVEQRLTRGAPLNRSQGERALALAQLVGTVQRVVDESGDAEGFDAPRWTADWLSQPCPALNGQPPCLLLDTADGRELVRRLILQAQSGAYA